MLAKKDIKNYSLDHYFLKIGPLLINLIILFIHLCYFLYTNQPHTLQMMGISTHMFMHVDKYTIHHVRSVFPARKTTMTRTL